MSTIQFSTVVGTTIAFDPLTDTLLFDLGSAAGLQLSQSGADVVVSLNGTEVRLASLSLASLAEPNLSFVDGSVVRIGAAGNDLLIGTSAPDYFDISAGGSDSVLGGDGNDVVIAGNQLGADDHIDGGIG